MEKSHWKPESTYVLLIRAATSVARNNSRGPKFYTKSKLGKKNRDDQKHV